MNINTVKRYKNVLFSNNVMPPYGPAETTANAPASDYRSQNPSLFLCVYNQSVCNYTLRSIVALSCIPSVSLMPVVSFSCMTCITFMTFAPLHSFGSLVFDFLFFLSVILIEKIF